MTSAGWPVREAPAWEAMQPYMAIVRQIALGIHRRLPRSVEVDDLCQAGALGLMGALSTTALSGRKCSGAYIRLRIQGAIMDSLRGCDWVSRYMRRRGRNLNQTQDDLRGELAQEPTSEEVAERMDLDLQSYFELASAVRTPFLVTSHEGADGDEIPIMDSLEGPAEWRPDIALEQRETRRLLLSGASGLRPVQCCIVLLHYFAEWPGIQISEALGISEARISQLHSDALIRLREGNPCSGASTREGTRPAAARGDYESGAGDSASVLRALLDILAQCERQTWEHSLRVQAYALRLAGLAGYPVEDMPRLRDAALLHDIGNVCAPPGILEKSGELDGRERRALQKHTQVGSAILARIPALSALSDIVEHHHERWDGTGYPGGLKGEQIPLGARIVAVADALDAMTSRRSYQPTYDFETALQTIALRKGTQFDPAVVGALLSIPIRDLEVLGAQWKIRTSVSSYDTLGSHISRS